MKHALKILRDEFYRLGGELFAKNYEKQAINLYAKDGNEKCIEVNKMLEFTNLLLGSTEKDKTLEQFKQVHKALKVLEANDES